MTGRVAYLDHAATTPVAEPVLAAMLPYMGEVFGNPSSTLHRHGREAAAAVWEARSAMAASLGAADPDTLVVTSGATESNHLAWRGVLTPALRAGRGAHVVTTAIEHPSVLDAARAAEEAGVEVTSVPPQPNGVVDADRVIEALRPDTRLVSVMAVNNETGARQPIADVGRAARSRGVVVHCDMTQAAGRLPISLDRMDVDLASLSAHKVYGPKGVGLLYVRDGVAGSLTGLFRGGHRGLRAGTVNVPGVVGFAAALRHVAGDLDHEVRRLEHLRQVLLDRLALVPGGARTNVDPADAVPAIVSVRLPGVDGADVVRRVAGASIGTGSACTTGRTETSHVLTAMGLEPAQARGALRISMGRATTEEQIVRVVDEIADVVPALREGATAPAGAVRP